MPFPASIPVKYSEDDAQFISIRPLVRQIFRPAELIDMIVSVTGKDPQRVQQILRSGTIVFNSYRYWWDAIDSAPTELATLLACYPDTDPSRPFDPQSCTEIILDSAATSPRHTLRIRRADAARKRLFRKHSFWHALIDLTRARAPAYSEYSYAHRADVYALPLDSAAIAQLTDAVRFAPRSLTPQLVLPPHISLAKFLCPRP